MCEERSLSHLVVLFPLCLLCLPCRLRVQYTACCPCFMQYEASSNISNDNTKGLIYGAGVLVGFGCCTMTVLGHEVAEKANIESSLGRSMALSCCNCFTFYSCRVMHQSRLLKSDVAPSGNAVKR